MNINAIVVKNYRCKFNWTQQTLAESCDISLRTIQRVERYGKASNETLMSLCAVFEIEQNILIVEERKITETTVAGISTVNPRKIAMLSLTLGIFAGTIMTYLFMI
jgi:DNA-binding XRE family transcriptional regulator